MIERLNAALHGQYLIEREIGSGGMSTVYLARDLRQDRSVALKVLRAELTALLGNRRFLAEIRTTANLQHPHILPLFDSGEADGLLFFTMPYIEGDTLQVRLQREGQLPIPEAIRIAAEVGDALDYAHRHGVIHRDVTPANILLHEGGALVADFGIALAVTAAAGGRITETGATVGTPQYMSPEQATGGSVDGRTDVYSLACVMYEVLTGRPPFIGKSAQAVLAQVLTAEPRPVRELRRKTPSHVDAALAIALQKLPADRFPDALSFARALQDRVPDRRLAPAPTSAVVSANEWEDARSAFQPISHRKFAFMGVLVTVITAVVIFTLWRLGQRDWPTPSSSVTRVHLQSGLGAGRDLPAMSPNGQTIAWPMEDGIHIRSLDQLNDRLIPGTRGASYVFFSPDSRNLGFSSVPDYHLRIVSVSGGPQRVLADSAGLGIWSDDGWIYFYRVTALGQPFISRVPANGGAVEVVLTMDTTRVFAPTSVVSSGKGILGTLSHVRSAAMNAEVQVGVLNPMDGTIKILLPGRSPRYEPQTRHIVFIQETSLMAAAYDPDRAEISGTPFVVEENVGAFGLSAEGTLWALLGPFTPSVIPSVLNRRGVPIEIMPELTLPEAFSGAHFSPDGQRVALEFKAADSDMYDIWLYDLPNGPRTRLTYDGGRFPVWTLDGRLVLFTRDDGVYRVRARASEPPERVLRAIGIRGVQPVSGGGIVFEWNNGTDSDIGFSRLEDDEPFLTLVEGPANQGSPTVSPDGRWLAYESDESGRPEIYVIQLGRAGQPRRISVAGGQNPFFA